MIISDIKINQLRYFLTVVEENGFKAASTKLHKSQPTISMAVRELESKLENDLLEKKAKHIVLTEFGSYCYPLFRDLVTHHDKLCQTIATHITGESGGVDIATIPSVANQLLPLVLNEFINNKLEINLHDGNSDFVFDLVSNSQVDFGIATIHEKEKNKEFYYLDLLTDEIGVVCHKDHPITKIDNIKWSDLENENIIINKTSTLLKNTKAEKLIKDKNIKISNMTSLLSMLEMGSCITTLPSLSFPKNNKNLIFIYIERNKIERKIGIVIKRNKTLSPVAQKIVDKLIDLSKKQNIYNFS